MDKKDLLDILPDFAGRRIAVVGDLFLDDYIVGQANRLSREAPIPVLEFTRRFQLPGGAANPALNISSLGGVALPLGIVGDDSAGQALLQKLQEYGLSTQGVVIDPARVTTTKTRILAEGMLVAPQQVARVDRVDRSLPGPAFRQRLLSNLEETAPRVQAILLSDYKTGVVSPEVAERAQKLAKANKKVLTVDSQGELSKFQGFDLVKCNRGEAEQAIGHNLEGDEDFADAGKKLMKEINAQALLITRGSEGMSLITKKQTWHLPAANRSEVFDVTGAGDTVIAVATLALAAGADILKAIHLANYAAGLVVRKLGNATVTPQELEWAIEHWS
ncbi:MAG: bifunctional hydroxymethylpyrimidine kinase/phosphomethylpyrimidine kinase [Chloroflexi bacterium]|nr:bifunctional hydroxymethylpyrimidine kinase/phosphomethylpyrimidine kinase [Chloroflexota bacterium]